MSCVQVLLADLGEAVLVRGLVRSPVEPRDRRHQPARVRMPRPCEQVGDAGLLDLAGRPPSGSRLADQLTQFVAARPVVCVLRHPGHDEGRTQQRRVPQSLGPSQPGEGSLTARAKSASASWTVATDAPPRLRRHVEQGGCDLRSASSWSHASGPVRRQSCQYTPFARRSRSPRRGSGSGRRTRRCRPTTQGRRSRRRSPRVGVSIGSSARTAR